MKKMAVHALFAALTVLSQAGLALAAEFEMHQMSHLSAIKMSFPRKRESRTKARVWIPTFVGMTGTLRDFQVKIRWGLWHCYS